MNQDLFINYRKLLNKVDDFSSQLMQTYRKHLACRRGCTDCCQHDLYLLPIEFHFLQEAFNLLPEAKKKTIGIMRDPSAGRDGPCPLLQEGGCLLYDHRPVVCRTHGLPLFIAEEGVEKRDCCPKNFVRHAIDQLPKSHLLDLERLNTLLVTVNTVFASHVGVDAGVRLTVSGLGHLTNSHGL
jgi:hypothetical protein